MTWMFHYKTESVSNKRWREEVFRLCHECGKKIFPGEAHIVTNDNRYAFHPACGYAVQERELKLQKEVTKQAKDFMEQSAKAEEKRKGGK